MFLGEFLCLIAYGILLYIPSYRKQDVNALKLAKSAGSNNF